MSEKDGEPGLFTTLATQRAVRRLRPDPVPIQVLEDLVWYATRAPSGGNRQPWELVVVTDRPLIERIGEVYRAAGEPVFRAQAARADDEPTRVLYRSALHLSLRMGEVPAVIVVCARVTPPRTLDQELSSIYPAVQNLLLAARGHGLGTVLTTIHRRREGELRALLAIPKGVETVCLIPVGYPEDPEQAFRPITARRPAPEVLHWQRY